jgi:chitinase
MPHFTDAILMMIPLTLLFPSQSTTGWFFSIFHLIFLASLKGFRVKIGLSLRLAQGFPPQKLVFGLPSYARSWTLADPNQHGLLAPAVGAGVAGQFTGLKGFYSFYEICLFQQQGMTVVEDPTGKMGPYGYLGDIWASWDSIDIVVAKVKYMMSKGLGGIQFWELSLDDFNGHCNLGLRYSYNFLNFYY